MYGMIIDKANLYDAISGFTPTLPMQIIEVNKSRKINLSQDEYLLCWFKKPKTKSSKPDIVAASKHQLTELLAHVSTYQNEYDPFTAFFRVLDLDIIESIAKSKKSNKDISSALTAFTGVVLAETALQTNLPSGTLKDISIQACLSSQSYVFAQALALNVCVEDLKIASHQWIDIRKSILGSKQLKIPLNAAQDFYLFVYGILSGNQKAANLNSTFALMAKSVTGAVKGHSPLKTISRDLKKLEPSLFDKLDLTLKNREKRVQGFDALIFNISQLTNGNRQLEEFLLGMVLSEISGGDFKYSGISTELINRFPISILWFGLFNALHEKSNLLSTGKSLGHRLLSKLVNKNVSDADINADIGVEEFLMTNEFFNSKDQLRTENSGIVRVELYPSLISTFRFRKNESSKKSNEFDKNKALIEPQKLYELMDTVNKAQSILRSIDKGVQRDLFSKARYD